MISTRLPSASTAVVLVLLLGTTAAPADTVETLGSIGAIALPASGLVAAAAHKDKKGALQLAEAYGTTMAIVHVLKPIVDRQRPDGGSQSYAVATFVAYSRVESKRHWTGDVIAGGAIGIASNLVFTHRFARVAVQPTAVPRGAGLTVEVRW